MCGAHQIYHLIATQSEAKILVWPSCGNICLCMAGGCPPLYIQYTVELENEPSRSLKFYNKQGEGPFMLPPEH